jgi:hypothetical protein
MATTTQLTELERNWLEAESVADELKHEAARIRSSASDGSDDEVRVLLKQAEELEARHANAELAASEAFDRFWQARNGGDTATISAAEIRAA